MYSCDHADLSGAGEERYFERRQAHDPLQGTGEVPFLDLEHRPRLADRDQHLENALRGQGFEMALTTRWSAPAVSRSTISALR
jgi:hypothetical protein